MTSLMSLTLEKTDSHVVKTLKQSYGEVCVVRNGRLLSTGV